MVRGSMIGLGALSLLVPLAAWGQTAKGAPKQDPAKWFTDLDYPADARRASAQGSVSVVLSIDTSGHVTGCRVSASSGNASLDAATCQLATRRGRFTVQTDAAGTPEPYSYAMSKAWSLTGR